MFGLKVKYNSVPSHMVTVYHPETTRIYQLVIHILFKDRHRSFEPAFTPLTFTCFSNNIHPLLLRCVQNTEQLIVALTF